MSKLCLVGFYFQQVFIKQASVGKIAKLSLLQFRLRG